MLKCIDCYFSNRVFPVTHTGEESYQCCYCDECFGSSCLQMLKHSDEKQYVWRISSLGVLLLYLVLCCMVRSCVLNHCKCELMLNRTECCNSNIIYLVNHTGGDPYQCCVCDKCYCSAYTQYDEKYSHLGALYLPLIKTQRNLLYKYCYRRG